jgi:hypothetical protein
MKSVFNNLHLHRRQFHYLVAKRGDARFHRPLKGEAAVPALLREVVLDARDAILWE